MKNKVQEVLSWLFSLFIIIAILGGGIILAMFIIAMIVGGDTGTKLATSASDIVMPYFIRAAAIAVLAGLIVIYTNDSHSLSLKNSNKDNS
ncbi:MAG TPA: hypothetical protein VK071_00545 [Tissierellales bacterium]|nr:hypothetical protein [Tissierellales bacterium]